MTALPKLLLDCAKDQSISADKFAALVSAHAAHVLRDAEAVFTRAFLVMAPLLPIIEEHGVMTYRDGRTGTYALNEDIQLAIGPILWAHGFTLTFTTEYPNASTINVTGILQHVKGHVRMSSFEAPADGSGGKTGPQGRGSIISYGHRYTSRDLLNLVTKGEDTDGAVSEPEPLLPTLPGFAEWFRELEVASRDGMPSLERLWSTAPAEFRPLVTAHAWNALKVNAEKVDAVL